MRLFLFPAPQGAAGDGDGEDFLFQFRCDAVDIVREHLKFRPYLQPFLLQLVERCFVVFIPMAAMFKKSLETLHVNPDYSQTYTFDWNWSNYSDALDKYHEQFVRAFEYAAWADGFTLTAPETDGISGSGYRYEITFRR